MKVLLKGTEITCPKCHRVMVRTNRDIRYGEILHSSMFDAVDAEPKQGDRTVCPFDQTPYMGMRNIKVNQVHTKDGWL